MAKIATVALLAFSLTTPLVPGLKICLASGFQGENGRLVNCGKCPKIGESYG
jgi:hypothetical protein